MDVSYVSKARRFVDTAGGNVELLREMVIAFASYADDWKQEASRGVETLRELSEAGRS